jgi:hypothetical protein
MQKIDMHRTEENATLAAATILYFSALILFSIWFTQS